MVNQAYLFEQYRTKVLSETSYFQDINKNDLYNGLSDLFTRAKKGEKESLSIVETAGRYIGHCLANAITILDIDNVIISGHFGPDGDVILNSVREILEENTLPKVRCSINYSPFDPLGHVKGAAILILKDYMIDIPREGIGSGNGDLVFSDKL